MPIYSVKSMNPYYSLAQTMDNARGLSTNNAVDHSANTSQKGMFMDFSEIPSSSPLNFVDSTMAAQKGMFMDVSEIPSSSSLNVVDSTMAAQKGMFVETTESEFRPSNVSTSLIGAGNYKPHYSLNISG